MRRLRIALLATTGLLAFASSASAADLRPSYRAPPPVAASYFSWTGFYFGTHTGVAFGKTTTENLSPFGGFDAGALRTYDADPANIFSGVQFGYNWQAANWLFGVEVDLGYLGMKQAIRPAPDDLVEVRYGWYGTVTGRVGLAWDRFLTYLKGGGAWARIRNTASDLDGTGAIDPTDFSEIERTRWGWTVGTGFEYAFLGNWSLKSEYLFMDFGRQTSTNLDGDTFEHRNHIHSWKIGVNYRWGGGRVYAN